MKRPMLTLFGLLTITLIALFWQSFVPGMAMFANDGPLGLMMSEMYRMPQAMLGVWNDLEGFDHYQGCVPFSPSALVMMFGPVFSNKFLPALSLLVVGMSAGLYFRTIGLGSFAIVAGGLAAGLNGDFFSYACWGLSSLPLCMACTFLALTSISATIPGWQKSIFAGTAVGYGLIEAFDNGAIMSLMVAAYAVFWSLYTGRGWMHGWIIASSAACVAAIVSCHVLITLVSGNVAGASGMGQDETSKRERWDWATQWSLPPGEALRAIVPGLYGYRMDSPDGRAYHGSVGADASWDKWRPGKEPPQRTVRFSGAGHYTGMFVALSAALALYGALGRKILVRPTLFWGAVAVVSLLLAFGRHAPFYRLFYELPYASTMRNPVKFLHPFSLAVVVLAGFGFELMSKWKSQKWEYPRSFVFACWLAVGAFVIAIASYHSRVPDTVIWLKNTGFSLEDAKLITPAVFEELICSAMLLATSAFVIWAAVEIGWGDLMVYAACGLLFFDGFTSNFRWVQHFNYVDRYQDNEVFKFLRQHRDFRSTARQPFTATGRWGELQQAISGLYYGEWLQHQFKAYNIRSFDVTQMPRIPLEVKAFFDSVGSDYRAMLERSGTRYLVTVEPAAKELNFRLGSNLFSNALLFDVQQDRPGHIVVTTNSVGPFAIAELDTVRSVTRKTNEFQSQIPHVVSVGCTLAVLGLLFRRLTKQDLGATCEA